MTALQPTVGDEVLEWASEVGSGSWSTLKEGIRYVCKKHDIDTFSSLIAAQLSNLGHLDMDWESKKWNIARPALNIVPNLGLCAILTGSRTHFLLELFHNAANNLNVYPLPDLRQPKNSDTGRVIAPSPVIIKCSTLESAKNVAEKAGIAFSLDPARTLGRALPNFSKHPSRRAAAPGNLDHYWFCPQTLKWEDSTGEDKPGLHRIDISYSPSYRWTDGELWWHTDLPTGEFLAIKENSSPIFRWTESPKRHGTAHYFDVLKGLHLPTLAM
ncbi:MAG TPA: hypothetical protein EYQ69_05410 [Gemmatimonadetes bacterium]|nr:hypothetical protein [Gemmatimonadota bacterium]